MKNQYNKTIAACFTGYIVQAIVNNFTPLLFLFFQRSYQIPLSQITLLVTFNFGIQLLVDLLSVGFVDRIGYRAGVPDDPAGDIACSFCRNFDFSYDLCDRRRFVGSACQSGCGGVSFG